MYTSSSCLAKLASYQLYVLYVTLTIEIATPDLIRYKALN